MSGIACLRICIEHAARETSVEGVTPVRIDRAAALYIDAHWPPPRRHGHVAPGAYVLIDPYSAFLDGEELKHLASELQLRLFGAHGREDLCLLIFEGHEAEVLRFSSLPEADLLAMRRGEPPPPVGRTRVVTRDGVRELPPRGSTPHAVAADATESHEAPRLGWRGVYNPVCEYFEASQPLFMVREPEWTTHQDGDYMRSDMEMLDASIAAIRRHPGLHVQTDFRMWSMVRTSLREVYGAKLASLPPAAVKQLSAQVYDVPRELPFMAIAPLRELLRPVFRRVELRTHDPIFHVQAVPEHLIDGVVLELTGHDDHQRFTNLQQFLSARRQYLDRDLRQGVAGLRSRRELELCREFRVPSVSGLLISATFEDPLHEQAFPHAELPFRSTRWP